MNVKELKIQIKCVTSDESLGVFHQKGQRHAAGEEVRATVLVQLLETKEM